jgi:hypothetical protein
METKLTVSDTFGLIKATELHGLKVGKTKKKEQRDEKGLQSEERLTHLPGMPRCLVMAARSGAWPSPIRATASFTASRNGHLSTALSSSSSDVEVFCTVQMQTPSHANA